LRNSNTVVFCAIDDLVPISNKPLTGFSDFLDSLAADGIPCVWITSRNRHQLDATLRRMAHSDPFIAEGGSCVYLAEDYFHLKPAHTVRLGRFISIPVAKPQPAAAEALAHLSGETGISLVPLRSLTPRELVQNTGLPKNEAETIRQRDFDELFFFAGTSDKDIERFRHQAAHLKYSVRPLGSLWSLAVNPSLSSCVRELRKLYDRAFHRPAFALALATASDSADLFPACDRAILLTGRTGEVDREKPHSRPSPKILPLFHSDSWTQALETIRTRSF
jgi:predicted mannosyl-3-phosphoglycerate phosphatase (HAD superfamily)